MAIATGLQRGRISSELFLFISYTCTEEELLIIEANYFSTSSNNIVFKVVRWEGKDKRTDDICKWNVYTLNPLTKINI